MGSAKRRWGVKTRREYNLFLYFTFYVYVCSLAHSTRFWLICRLRSWFIIRASAPEDVADSEGGGGGCVGDQHEASERQKAAMSASECVCVREHEYERVRVRVPSLSLSQEGSLLQKKWRREGENEQAKKKRESNLYSLMLPRSRSLGASLDFDAHCTALATTVRESSVRLLVGWA